MFAEIVSYTLLGSLESLFALLPAGRANFTVLFEELQGFHHADGFVNIAAKRHIIHHLMAHDAGTVKGATLIGNGPDVLTKVTRIGHDLKLDEGVGTCQKAGQAVPVGVGLPTVLVSEITVGGTARG